LGFAKKKMVEEMSGVAALEEHFVVRFPLSLARRLRGDLFSKKPLSSSSNSSYSSSNSGNSSPISRVEMSFSDQRHAIVRLHFADPTINNASNATTNEDTSVIGNVSKALELSAVLVDLPTICETLRTTDASQYVKVCDVSRVLLVLDPEADDCQEMEQKLRRCDYQWPNGLTPPTVGLGRLRRVVRTARLEAAEREARRLLDADATAQRVSFALHVGDKVIKRGGDLDEDEEPENDFEASTTQALDDDYDFAAELEGSLEKAADDDNNELDDIISGHDDDIEDEERRAELAAKRAQAAAVTNPLIRARLQAAIADLEADLKTRRP
jgi:TATA-binding protein-associated factor Taf7